MITELPPAKPILVAHRGDAARHPENSLAAFASAAELGLHWVELDVQVTADGVPIVLHDSTLARTHGINVDVTETRLDELAALGVLAGGDHPPLVPTLAEFAAWMRGKPQLHVFVEIKKESLRVQGRSTMLAAVEASVETLRARAVIISYDARVLAMARRDGWPVGYALERMNRRYRAIAERLAPDYLFAEVAHLERAGKLWAGPWQWAAFELEDAATARRIAALGVRYLETMNPALLAGATI
ncbi:MAG: glycerophosphodiester phosphodiesterase family protein [Gammaproteobacteria bacterium]